MLFKQADINLHLDTCLSQGPTPGQRPPQPQPKFTETWVSLTFDKQRIKQLQDCASADPSCQQDADEMEEEAPACTMTLQSGVPLFDAPTHCHEEAEDEEDAKKAAKEMDTKFLKEIGLEFILEHCATPEERARRERERQVGEPPDGCFSD